jgi:hypothetical protein
MTPKEINRKFAKLARICCHEENIGYLPDYGCICGFKDSRRWVLKKHLLKNPNPDFCADPRLVLEVMMKREDWSEFLFVIVAALTCKEERCPLIRYILDTTGLLAVKAIEWMEGKEKVPICDDDRPDQDSDLDCATSGLDHNWDH